MNHSLRLSKKGRQDRILVGLRISAIRISELAAELGVSTETIRRDSKEMGESGSIDRTYGGAVARPFGFEPAWNERFSAMTEERARIAVLAARLVRPGEVLAIDAGSTTLHFARRLAAELRDLTVVTNSFAVAMALSANRSIKVIACPGHYDAHEGSVNGPDTITFFSRFNFNRAFIGASGITIEGPNEVDSGAAAGKRAMLLRTEERILLIDHSKFGEPHLEVICPIGEIHRIVSDRAPRHELADALHHANVDIHTHSTGDDL